MNNVELQTYNGAFLTLFEAFMAFAVKECAALWVGALNQGRSAGCNFKMGHPTYKTESLPYGTRRDR